MSENGVMDMEPLDAAVANRNAVEQLLSTAVNRGDMEGADRHLADYLKAAAEQDRAERELVENYSPNRTAL